MAIEPKDIYPGQTLVGAPGYPNGAAKNRSSEADRSGTPLEQTWVNDLWGWQQAILDEGGLSPSGVPDRVGASQYLEATQAIIKSMVDARLPTLFPIPLNMVWNASDRWESFLYGSAVAVRQKSVDSSGNVKFVFSIPFSGVRIKEDGLWVFLKGAAGHPQLPFMPRIRLSVQGRNQGVLDEGIPIGDYYVDPSATVGAYESAHILRPPMAAINTSPERLYYLEISGESSGEAVVGLECRGAHVQLEPIPT